MADDAAPRGAEGVFVADEGVGSIACACPLRLATGVARRARGLLFSCPDGKALLLAPCNDVHTVGMGSPIDVAFIDRDGRVLEACRDVGPLRRVRNRRAVAVVERFSSSEAPWFRSGEQIGIVGMEGTEL